MARARTGVVFDSVRGRLDQMVVVQTRSGLGVRRRPVFAKALTPAQREGNERLRQAAALWQDLTLEEVAAWRDYAGTLVRRNPVNGQTYAPAAYNAFTMLTTKFLQVQPEADPPRNPPKGGFLFESPNVQAKPVPGGVLWTALGPTGTDELAELMVQRLPNPKRLPGNQYVAAAFVPFVEEPLQFFLPLGPAGYSLACRFVRPSTGEQTGLGIFGTIVVE